jgi:ABC-type transport system substrate-binding protein
MRKAISYAVNYSSYFRLPNLQVKAKGPIPEGILYHNITGIDVPYYNISVARQALIDGNWPKTDLLTANSNISAGNEWEKLVDNGTPLATYNYSSVYDWPGCVWHGVRITEDLKQIGVKVEPVNLTFAQWAYQAGAWYGDHRNRFHFGYLSWVADYNDPSNFINHLYTNKEHANNFGQVNDTQVQEWMEEALTETDATARRQLYYKIQKRLIEEVCPNVWTTSWIRTDVYVSNLRGWYPHPFKNSFKSVYFV